MFQVVLACDGVTEAEGREAALDITKEFNEHRQPRYQNAFCTFDSGTLWLSCDNDGWDADGVNLMDEFSDCICAYLAIAEGRKLRFVSSINHQAAS